MKLLKFKIITFEETNDGIVDMEKNYENLFDENLLLSQILDELKNLFEPHSDRNNIIIYNFYELTWGKYFKKLNNDNNLFDERITEDYYKYTLKDLNYQFGFANNVIEVLINPPVGDSVGVNRGIHYFFHTREKDLHHIPHIHVRSGSIEFRVNLLTLELIDNITFKNTKKQKLALKMIKLNQKELINYWNKVVVKGEKIKFKMFFPYK